MAAKLNKSFLVTVIVVAAAVVLVLGGVAFYLMRLNPERNIANGDELLAQGDYEGALKEYGRAVNKESGNQAYLAKFEDTLLKIRPESSQRAFELYTQWISVLSVYAQLNPMDEKPAVRLLEELYGNARMTNMRPLWDTLKTAAADILSRNSEMTVAEYYKVAAEDQLRNFVTLSASEVQLIQDQLEEQVREHPDDARRLYSLMLSQLQLAYREFVAGRRTPNNRYVVRAGELAATAAERFPDSLELAILRVRWLSMQMIVMQERNATESERRQMGETVLASLNRVWELAQKGGHPEYAIIEAAEVLSRFGGRTGPVNAISLLNEHLAEHPNALFHRYILSKIYFDQGQLAQAKEQAEKLMAVEPMTTSFLAQLRFDVQQGATKMLFDVAYARYDSSSGAEADQALAEARRARDTLAAMYADPGQSPEVALCDAWLALAKRDFNEAAARFEFAISKQTEPEFRTYVGAARALEGRNELGAARQRLEQAREMQPGSTFVLIRLARVCYSLGEYARAEEYADAALSMNSDLPDAMAVRMEARRAQNKEVDSGAVSGPLAVINEARQKRDAGDADGARRALNNGIGEYPDVPALRLMLIEVEANAGNKDAALAAIAAFRERFPSSAAEADLIRIEGVLQGRDPLEIVRDVVNRTTPNEADRPIRLLVTLTEMANAEEQRAAQHAQRGETEAAETARQNATKYRNAAEQARAQASQAAPDHPALVEFRFRDALASSDWRAAEQIVLEAKSKNLDRANGRLYEGRLAIARGRFVDAATALVEATRLQPHDSDTWRLLGRAYEEVGNVVDAVKAYASSYERDPADPQTIRLYASILMQTGRNQEALEILRASKAILAGDEQLREARLALEAQFGEVSQVIHERRDLYKSNPDGVENAIRLALLLGSATPRRADVVDPNTSAPKYSETMWSAIPAEQRQPILEEVRQKWVAEGQSILAALTDKVGADSLDLAVARAYFLRDQGQIQEGEQVLRTFVETHRPPTATALLQLADYQGSIGRVDEAIATMEAAIAYQNKEQREADAALARAYFSRGQFDRAKRHYEEVYKVDSSRATEIRIIECEINMRNFEAANTRLQKLVTADQQAGRSPIETLLLGAAVDRGMATDLLAANKGDQASIKFAEEVKKLDRAVELAPSSPVPLLHRAQAKRRQYLREERANPSLIDQALLDLNTAISLQAGYLPAHVTKAEVFMAKMPPDTSSAIETLRNVLRISPREDDIRQSLITLLVGTNQRPQAIRAAQDAIAQSPTNARWHEALGDLYALANPPMEGGFALAQRAYEEAFRLRPTRDLLIKQSRALLSMAQRDPARVIRLIDGNEEMLKATPLLRCYRGMAYALRPNGQPRAEEDFTEAYRMYRTAIAQGNAPSGAIGEWFLLVGEAFASKTVDEVESFIRRAIGGELSSIEYEHLAELHYRRGSSRSVDFLKRAIDTANDEDRERRAQLMFRVGSMHQAYGQYQEAVALYEEIRKFWPDHAATLNNLAFIYADNMGQAAKAEPIARRALDLAPNNYNVLDTMGAVCLGLKKYEEAERHLLRSIQIHSEPGNLLHLAKVYAATNRAGQARQTLQEALKLNPDPATAREIRQLLDDITQTGQ